ncbi:MAG: hypothetical protein M0042_12955 [Nitrospiraceae bacterium]|nr:hypothetical protein [Nitrospiraceae bacterium]
MAYERHCSCGSGHASFHFRDNIMPEQVVKELYCPACGKNVKPDSATMVADNGWLIRYDMDIAAFSGQGRIEGSITPATLFDEGYCTWNGMYPGDHIDSVREREKIIALAKIDPIGYIKQLKTWAVERTEKLKQEGWRKAQTAA